MIVVGGSLGGCEALRTILQRLPAGYRRPIAVVLHRHKDSDGLLVPTLQRGCAIPVKEPEDKEPIRPGHVYVCPGDYHLMLDGDRFALSTDDLVNFARPSVDVLFESAAEWREGKVVAVVLTGSGADGARGASWIAERGGTVVVQDPATADGPWMPAAALASTPAARPMSLSQIADYLLESPR
ncbi:MAG: chemotaxis protein CheB [Lacunisphaera sp.]